MLTASTKIFVGLLATFFLTIVGTETLAQRNLHHASTGNMASSSSTNGQFVVSQSLGQTSPTGSFSNNNRLVFQGFQQPLSARFRASESDWQLNAWPNPCLNELHIAVNDYTSENFFLRITDLSGRVVEERMITAAHRLTLDLSTLLNGSYLLTLTDGRRSVSIQLIKQ